MDLQIQPSTVRTLVAPDAEYCGVPVFLHFSNVERELARQPRELEAIELARTNGWRRALEKLYDERTVMYSTAERRLKFLDVVPLTRDMRVLEIGVGFGQFTPAIASRVRQVDTLEVRLVNAVFAKLRCEQEGVTNATFACGGDDCRLPFLDNTYDAVLLNLVLEWCASNNCNESVRAGQSRFLSEITRVLKPGGLLQLNTKNRFAWRLLTGGRDEHACEMRFGSALPRWLMHIMLRLRGNDRPSGHLYSWGALKRLIKCAGLTPIQSCWAVPEMRFPDRIIPVDTRTIRAARRLLIRQGDSRRTHFLMRATPASFVRYVAPGHFFIARKP